MQKDLSKMQILTFGDKLVLYGFQSNSWYVFDSPVVTNFNIRESMQRMMDVTEFGFQKMRVPTGPPIIDLDIAFRCGKAAVMTGDVANILSGLTEAGDKMLQKVKKLSGHPLELTRDLRF